jgi:hypothetical protein
MTVILVLVTFLTFIVLDYVLNRKKALSTVPVHRSAPQPRPRSAGTTSDGFHTPEQVSYHPGHTGWCKSGRA